MRHSLTAIVLACVALGGCEPKMQMPPGFVEVDKYDLGPYDQRAVSADGVVVALRSETNPKNASLDFWVTAIRDELVNRRGYFLTKKEPLAQSGDTAPGRLMTFTAQRSGVEFTYMVVVYVQGGKVLIAEAGGKSETVVHRMADLRKALSSVRAGGV
jgi:hypothetical protein